MKPPLPHDDPSRLLRYRDSIYAADLLVCAIAWFDFFTFLNQGPKTLDDICGGLKIQPRPTDVLLSLLLSMELITTGDDGYALTDLAATYFTSTSPDSLAPYYASLKNRPQCVEFREVLQSGRPAGWSSKKAGDDWLTSMQDQAFADAFTAAMDSRGTFLAGQLAQKLDLGQYNSLLDIAGGSGIYACALAEQNSGLGAAVLEISPVDRATARSVQSKGLADRVRILSGNMLEAIPTGFDVHLFANAWHDWGMATVRKLATNAFESLSANGLIAVFDAHLNPAKNGPLAVAEYSCLLMHSTEGRCYSTQEISDVLTSVGFFDIAVLDVAADRTVVTGKKT